MIFKETVMGMMGERRLTGRVDTQWQAAVFHLSSGSLWVADVLDAGLVGLGLRVDIPAEGGDAIELALRDVRGRQARVAGTITNTRRPVNKRFGVSLTQTNACFIEMLVAAFQAELLAEARPDRRVDFGLAEVTRLPVRAAGEGAAEPWRTTQLAEVIPYRRDAAVAGTLLTGARSTG